MAKDTLGMKRMCHMDGCQEPVAWRMEGKRHFVAGYLCDHHKESWYDAREDHNSIIVRCNSKGEALEMEQNTEQAGGGKLRQSADADSPGARLADRSADGGRMERGRRPADHSQGGELERRGELATQQMGEASAPRGQTQAYQVGALGRLAPPRPLDDDTLAPMLVDVPDDWYEIRPDDGAVYLPHGVHRAIFNRAWGYGGWRLIPLGQPKVAEQEVVWIFEFLTRDGYYTCVPGHHVDRRKKSYSLGDALESAKSDAISRVAKDLPWSEKLLDRQWCEGWKAKYAERVFDNQAQGYVWRKKGEALQASQGRQGYVAESEYKPRNVDRELEEGHIDAIREEN